MTAYLESLLRDVFAAQGAADPDGLARRAAAEFERDQRDRRIYELRASCTEPVVAERFGLTSRQVRYIVKRQHAIQSGASLGSADFRITA